MFFIGENLGWICGDNGVILKTTNSGNDWNIIYTNTNYTLRSIYFSDSMTGWTVGGANDYHSGIIFGTSDGGTSWHLKDHPAVGFLENIKFKDDYGLITGYGGSLSTINGGDSWSKDSIGGFNSFITESKMVYIGGFLRVYRWDGQNWFDLWSGLDPYPEFYSLYFLSDSVGFAAITRWVHGGGMRYSGMVAKTNNYGNTWEKQLEIVNNGFNDICFTDSQNGWVVGGLFPYLAQIDTGKAMFKTTNCGLNWTEVELPDTLKHNQLHSVYMINQSRGYAVGDNGIIIKSVTPNTSINNSSLEKISFNLFQNYPNPFNSITLISFNLNKQTHVTLTIYNVLGKEIKTLIDEYKKAGTYKILFDAANVESGIYFYQLKTPESGITKKMILLK